MNDDMKTAILRTGLVAAVILSTAVSVSLPAAEPTAPSDKAAPATTETGPRIEGSQIGGRWREGSRMIDQLGSFKNSGDRVIFFANDGKTRFDCLDNLASERVGHTISDNPDQLEWLVSGTLTESHGSNFLLITQAVLKTKSARPRR